MPGRRNAGSVDTTLCRRCQTNEPAVTARNEAFCRSCFCRYVSTKVVKRMETFRVRHSDPDQARILLLPLSFDASSTSLLHVLSSHLQGQVAKTGRTGFKLHVLHIEDDIVSTANEGTVNLLNKVKYRYPDHSYSISPLSDICSFDEASTFLATAGIDPAREKEESNTQRVQRLLHALEFATSRTDMIQIFKRKLIVGLASSHNCEAVLWSDSTTSLAEFILAETAKGRGQSLPWNVRDGESPQGVPVYFPMKDLLRSEIVAFATLTEPPLDDLVRNDPTKPSVSMKNTTIDDLMRQYFEGVEREYPSIVANVVKTAGKLEVGSLSHVERQCELCDMPLDGQAPERSRLCYGCIRMLPLTVD